MRRAWVERLVCVLLAAGCDAPSGPYGLDARPPNPSCVASARAVSSDVLGLEPILAGLPLAGPTFATFSPTEPERLYITEKRGLLHHADPGDAEATTALDLSDVIVVQQGLGLASVAFDPDFATNGAIYVAYATTCERSEACPSEEERGNYEAFVSRVARFRSEDGGETFRRDSEEIILDAWQPADTHMVDGLVFAPDGTLTVGLGDGGCCGDPQRLAQDLSVYNGKILRIDVSAGGPGYVVPPDNPFVDSEGALGAIWAYGFRNPWRHSFDRVTGALWSGDVGQDTWEEVNLVARGGDHGWSEVEGPECFREGCDLDASVAPVAWYNHTDGRSVIGGHVYRGAALPDLEGAYIFGDYARRQVWALWTDGAHTDTEPAVDGAYAEQLLLTADDGITSFFEDADGELYVILSGGHDDAPGAIYRLVPPESAEDTTPATLSQTGCVDPLDPTQPASGLIPYDINAPFWSDGATKRRWMAIPDGETIGVQTDGDLSFPEGTVLMKEFTLDGARVEARLFMLHGDGVWAGYVYQWRSDGSDADLVTRPTELSLGAVDWHLPTRSECSFCHSGAAGRALGPEARQLDRDYDYPGGRSNQWETLRHIGLLDRTEPGDVARWRLDQRVGPLADDSAGEHDALLVGGPVWTGSALAFDGVDDHVETSVSSGAERTLALWVLPRDGGPTDATAGLIDANTGRTPGRYGLGLGLRDGALRVTLADGEWETGVQLTLDRWQQLTLSVGDGVATLYVDGHARATRSYDVDAPGQDRSFHLGCSADGEGCFRGALRDVRVFDRALSAVEALQLGMGADPDPLLVLEPYPDPFGEAPTGLRARAWLHTNCAPCHRPEGPGDYDLRYDTPLDETGMCDAVPALADLDIEDARLLAPGDPARSMLWQRIQDTGSLRMPPISSGVPDLEGVALIEAWIRGLPGCE